MGRYDEALQAYDAVIAEHPENAVAKSGRAETLRSMGRHEEALQAYDALIATYPQDIFAKNGCAETLSAVAEMRLGQPDAARLSLAAVDVAEDSPPITLIRMHVAGVLGERDEAEQMHCRLPEQLPHDQHELRDELERRYLSCLPAGQSDDWVFNREIECLLTAA